MSSKTLHKSIYNGFIYNCQNLEETKISLSRRMDKLRYICSMEYIQQYIKISCKAMRRHERNLNAYY
jgi:hypothetical protein